MARSSRFRLSCTRLLQEGDLASGCPSCSSRRRSRRRQKKAPSPGSTTAGAAGRRREAVKLADVEPSPRRGSRRVHAEEPLHVEPRAGTCRRALDVLDDRHTDEPPGRAHATTPTCPSTALRRRWWSPSAAFTAAGARLRRARPGARRSYFAVGDEVRRWLRAPGGPCGRDVRRDRDMVGRRRSSRAPRRRRPFLRSRVAGLAFGTNLSIFFVRALVALHTATAT